MQKQISLLRYSRIAIPSLPALLVVMAMVLAAGNATAEVRTPEVPAQMHQVTFHVDMTTATDFDPGLDVVYITGTYNGWSTPGDDPETQLMEQVDDSSVYTITLMLETGEVAYKYFLNPGWSEGEWSGDPNRVIHVDADMTVDNVWGVLDGHYTVTFDVRDEEDQPVDNGVVTFDGVSYPQGHYQVLDVPPGTWTWQVAAPGFSPQSGMVEVVDEDVTVSMVLEPGEPVFPVTLSVNDASGLYQALMLYGDLTDWESIPMNEDPPHQWHYTMYLEPGTWEWGVYGDDGSGELEWLLPGDNLSFVLHEDGEISGETSFVIEAPEPGTHPVTFLVDMSTAVDFDPEYDIVHLTGTMLDWATPGDDPANQVMSRVDDSMVWSKTLELEAGYYEYKYFLNDGWDQGEWGGTDNRSLDVDGAMTVEDEWGGYEGDLVVTFVVEDMDGAPVEDAIVSLDGQPNPPGEYEITGVFPGHYPWVVAAPGHVTASGDVNVTEDVTIEVILVQGASTLMPVTITVVDESMQHEAILFRGSMTNWENVPMSEKIPHVWTRDVYVLPGSYEWAVVEDDGSDTGLWLLPTSENLHFQLDNNGFISGQISLVIESTGLLTLADGLPAVYPNPVEHTLFVELPQKGSLVLIDVTGGVIHSQTLSPGTHTLDMSGYTPGVYLLRMDTEEGRPFTRKIIKQ